MVTFLHHPAKIMCDSVPHAPLSIFSGWMSAEHPDPFGTTLRAVREFLRRAQSNTRGCGLFWGAMRGLDPTTSGLLARSLPHPHSLASYSPRARTIVPLSVDWASLPQKAEGTERNELESEMFKRGLEVMGFLYASVCGTSVLQHKHTQVPTHVSNAMLPSVACPTASAESEEGNFATAAGSSSNVPFLVAHRAWLRLRMVRRAAAGLYNTRPYDDRGWVGGRDPTLRLHCTCICPYYRPSSRRPLTLHEGIRR